jgi:hypothetical protein
VAATDRAARRRELRARRARRPLHSLSCFAAGLGALAAREAVAQSTLDARFLFYKESNGRNQILNPLIFFKPDLGPGNGELDVQLGYDSLSGASPTGGYPSADVTTSASGSTNTNESFPQAMYSDTRKSGSLAYRRKFGAHLPSIDVSYSKENDYEARSIGLSDAWTMAGGRGTLHFGASISRDIVSPVTTGENLAKDTNGFALGWTWVLGERDLLDVSASLMLQSGYLDDPYKVVPVGTINNNTNVPERRPDSRQRFAFLAKYGHYFLWDGALKASYRYYRDDWSVQAHTLDVTYDQKLGPRWIVSPRARIYTQSGASFYGSLFASPETFMSADSRLSPFDSLLGGLTVTHQLNEAVSLNLGGTYQVQLGNDRVTPATSSPGGTGAAKVSSADMDIVTVTVGLGWKF